MVDQKNPMKMMPIPELWCLLQDNRDKAVEMIKSYCLNKNITFRKVREQYFADILSETTGWGTYNFITTNAFTKLCYDCLDASNMKV